MYPLSKEDKKLRNKIEAIVIAFYTLGLFLSVITSMPIFILVTVLSVPFCMNKKISDKLNLK